MEMHQILVPILSAVTGGSMTATMGYIALHGKVKTLESKTEGILKALNTCQTEREYCRASMRDHHENPDKHVDTALVMILKDIQVRLERMENKLMNGSTLKK